MSIVINTDGRADSLRATLQSLAHIDYPEFEVCVVAGPTQDGTHQLLAGWHGRIKSAECPERNVSVSRNIGIALAAGDIVAFIDDDAIPEPEWLRDLVAAYETDDVGGAGGFVHDHTGVAFQYRFGTVDRLGRADLSWTRPAPELNFPFTAHFPHLLGTNASFRRTALLDVRGFDEEYDYYLDETDLCCRLIDAGWHIAQVAGAYVHHKFLPSSIRTARRVLSRWYPIIKNKIYFSLVNGRGHHSLHAAIENAQAFIADHSRDVEGAIAQGALAEESRGRFWLEVDRAWRDGIERGLRGHRQLLSREVLARYAAPYVKFVQRRPADGRRAFCFVCRDPAGMEGARDQSVYQLARAVASLGHHTHVLTGGEGHDRVDFEEGVWVHRIVDRDTAPGTLPDGTRPPRDIWSHAATILAETARIAQRRRIDAVIAPIRDGQGLAILEDQRFPLVSWLHDPAAISTDGESGAGHDHHARSALAGSLRAIETRLVRGSAGLLAHTRDMAALIETAQAIRCDGPETMVVPLGSEDWSRLPLTPPPAVAPGALRVLFVGRRETGTGIDIRLEAALRVLPRCPHLHLDIVGDDPVSVADGVPSREVFDADERSSAVRGRVAFHGRVSDDALRGFYRACDVVVAPFSSDFPELLVLEAMMFAKPVVGCRAGGIVEIVEDGVTGLLVEPGDATSLAAALHRLIVDGVLRTRLGTAARLRYETTFTAERMAAEIVAFLSRAAARRTVDPPSNPRDTALTRCTGFAGPA